MDGVLDVGGNQTSRKTENGRRLMRVLSTFSVLVTIFLTQNPSAAVHQRIQESSVKASTSTVQPVRTRHYCEYKHADAINSTNNCHTLLSPHVRRKRAWFFFGDSQMGFLFKSMEVKYPYTISETKESTHERCGFLTYCNIPRAVTWIPPSTHNQTQGPLMFGLRTPFCSDLSGHSYLKFSNGSCFMEYLAVEFASDVEQQTPYGNTTQETATFYVKLQLGVNGLTREDSVCVVNTGVHDQILCKEKSDATCLDMYSTNVRWHLSILRQGCGSIIWISTTSVAGDPKYPQTNKSLLEWNRVVNEKLVPSYSEAFYVDVWNLSATSPRNGNIHFQPEYYDTLGSLFTGLM